MSGLQNPIPKSFNPTDDTPSLRVIREIDYKLSLRGDPIPFPAMPKKKKTIQEKIQKQKNLARGRKIVGGLVSSAIGRAVVGAANTSQGAPQPAPARQPPQPQNTGRVNIAQIGVRKVSSIGGGGGGGGGGEPPRGGGGGGGGGGGPPRNPRQRRQPRRQRVGGQPVRKAATMAPRTRKPRTKKPKQSTTQPLVKQPTTKPKRDIQKITTPKPQSKVRQAAGTTTGKVSRRGPKPTEETRPTARGRVRGVETTPRGRGPRPTY